MFPIFGVTAANGSILAAVFIVMMVSTMEGNSWDQEEKTANALLCMLGVGMGEILGAICFGRIIDKFSVKVQVGIAVLTTTLAYALLLFYTARYEFSFVLACILTTVWGFSDACTNTLNRCILGF